MARANTIQTNFTSGEVSPLMYGRVDTTKYFNGARKLQNMVVLPQGGAYRRPGTVYQGNTKSNGYAVLRKFVFSATQTYTLEFGNLYLRFWKTTGQVTSAGSPYEIATPYLLADLPYLCFAQSADVVYITNSNYPVMKLSRFADTNWTLTTVNFLDGPYLDIDSSTNQLTLTLVSDITTLVSNATGGVSTTLVAASALFANTDPGKYVEYVKSNVGGTLQYGLALVTAFTDSTHDTGTTQSVVQVNSGTITFGGGQVISNVGIFTPGIVGQFIRLTASQTWYLITAFVDTKHMSATVVTLIPWTTQTVTANAPFAVGDVGKYIQYQQAGIWHIALIMAYISPTNVSVQVVNGILNYDSTVAVSAGVAGASIFSPTDLHKYYRDTAGPTWYKINAYGSGTTVTAAAPTMHTYTYPGIVMTLLNDRAVIVTISSRVDVFDPINDVGNTIRVKYGASWRYVKLTSITSPSQATGTMSDFFPLDPRDADIIDNGGVPDAFRLPAWTLANGYASQCAFHQGRLWTGRSTLQPSTMWSSEIDDYEAMSPTDPNGLVLDTNAITLTIANNRVNRIMWISSGPVMLVGTEGDEFQIKPSNVSATLTPANFSVTSQTRYGSIETSKGLRIDYQTLFVQNGGLKIREMTYDFTIDAYHTKDISLLSEHLFRFALSNASNGNPLTSVKGIVQLDFGTQPVNIGWMVMADGTLVGMTYEKDQDVIAFHLHGLGPNNGVAVIESVCVIPDPANGTDVVFLSVRRVVNGSTVRFIETFRSLDIFAGNTGFISYLDSTVVLPVSGNIGALDSVSLAPFIGETLGVLVDGLYVGALAVVSNGVGGGRIVLNYAVVSTVIVGYANVALVGILDPEGGSQGSSQGKIKKSSEAILRVEASPHPQIAVSSGMTDTRETVSGVVDPQQSDWTRIIPGPIIAAPNGTTFPSPGTYPSTWTGDISVALDQSWNSGGRFQIIQPEPYPLKLLAVMIELNSNE